MPEDKPVPFQRYPSYSHQLEDVAVIAPSHSESDDPLNLHLRDYWRIIVGRRWTVLSVLLTTVLVTLIWTLKQIPVYQATTSVQIDRENPNILKFADVYQVESGTDDTLRTQFEVLKSRSLARKVIEDLKLDANPEFQPAPPSLLSSFVGSITGFFRANSAGTPDVEPDRLRPVIDTYISRLAVAPVRQARLVNISFEAEDPELAARIINAHGAHYKEQNLLVVYEATQEASRFLEDQLGSMKIQLEKSEDDLQAYSSRNDILFTDEGKNTATERLQQLEEQFTTAQIARARMESYVTQVREGRADSLPQLTSNSLVTSLSGELANLRRRDEELAVDFEPFHVDRQRVRNSIQEAERSIEDEKRRVVDTIQTEYLAAVENEKILGENLDRQRAIVNQINQSLNQYNILSREVQTNREISNGLLTRLREAGISAGLGASNIRIVDRAEVPVRPVRPRTAMNLMLSMVGGLLFGVGFAFFREYLDDTIKAPDDVTRFFGMPTLGIIPRHGSLMGRDRYGYGYGNSKLLKASIDGKAVRKATELWTHDEPLSVMAEAYRSIRTSLLLSSPEHAPRMIVISSAVPSEGKTVTAVNMAISLTQVGSRVVILDADMRKPRVHQILGLGSPVGLSAFLTGNAALREVIHKCAVPNLFVVPCGVTPPNPGELILSTRFKRLLEVLREYFDYVIIDSPPLNSVSDARVLATSCDRIVMVIKAGSTSRHQVRHAIEHLTVPHTHIAGVVLNDLDVRNRAYYGSQYYYNRTYGSDKREPEVTVDQ